MNAEQFLTVLFDSLKFVSEKHSDQKRKGANESPYLNHLIDVANLLWEVGNVRHYPTLIAALLHDVLEDTKTSEDEVRRKFGEEVLQIVLEVSDDKSLLKEVRKNLQISHASNISLPAKLIKLADKISNVSEMNKYPPLDWSKKECLEYAEWSNQVVKAIGSVNQQLEEKFEKEYLIACKKYGK